MRRLLDEHGFVGQAQHFPAIEDHLARIARHLVARDVGLEEITELAFGAVTWDRDLAVW